LTETTPYLGSYTLFYPKNTFHVPPRSSKIPKATLW
jgi:hypothetical protein